MVAASRVALAAAGIASGSPVLALAAPCSLAAWWLHLRTRVGGMSGACLGAGVESAEIGMLLALVAS
jgi:adenosylcobinamide-GDP ribazoletransferase